MLPNSTTTLVVTATAAAAWAIYCYYKRPSKWRPLEYPVLFGIIGGLGPRATSIFVDDLIKQRILLFQEMCREELTTSHERFRHVSANLPSASANWTEAELERVFCQTSALQQLKDEDHVPLLLAQATSVPSRPKYILQQPKDSPDPLPQLAQVGQALVDAGATHLAIVCNTAHYFWPRMRQCIHSKENFEFLDMIQLTLDYVEKRHGQACRRIGILATRGTLECRLINGYSSNKRFDFFSPLDISSAHQDVVETCIFGKRGIKTGFDRADTKEGRANLLALLGECAAMKREFDIQVVVLFCSELPLLLNPESLRNVLEEEPELRLALGDIRAFLDPSMLLVHEVLRIALLSRQS